MAAVYLAASDYTNGVILSVDGGVSLVNPWQISVTVYHRLPWNKSPSYFNEKLEQLPWQISGDSQHATNSSSIDRQIEVAVRCENVHVDVALGTHGTCFYGYSRFTDFM